MRLTGVMTDPDPLREAILSGDDRTRLLPAWDHDLNRILAAPWVRLGRWPTPIEEVIHAGKPLLVKRDDLSGFGRGGAKTRKIEHVLGLMRARGSGGLITVIGNITNLGFDLLPALRKCGLSWRIFVQNDPPLSPEARASLFFGIEPHLRFLGRSRAWSTLVVLAEWLKWRAIGKQPFLLLPGASHPVGVLGNARGFVEMVRQLQSAGRPLPSKVFVSVATGTTVAGFLLAENALRRAGCEPIEVIGVQVYPGNVARRTRLLLRWTERQLGLEHPVDGQRIDIRAGPFANRFGPAGPDLDALCDRVHAKTGLKLDPIFGAKTWGVMEQELRLNTASERPAMFWHCGYTPNWPSLASEIRRGHRTRNPIAEFLRPSRLVIIALYVAAFYCALPALLWSFGRRLDRVLALPAFDGSLVPFAGWTLVAAGLAIILLSIHALFSYGAGLPMSHLPPIRLVSAGVYRWFRHPHYVGYNLAFIGCGLVAGSPGQAIGAGLLLLGLWLLYAKLFEEPRLERRFGAHYAEWRDNVRLTVGDPLEGLVRRTVVWLRAPLERLANRLMLFRTGPVLWVTYGLFAALAAIVMGGGIAFFLLDQGRPGFEAWWSVGVLSATVALGSRAAWFLIPGDKPRDSFLNLLRRVGFVSWGGYVAGLGAGPLLAATLGVSPLRMLDAMMMLGLIASAISRWGCLSYGCCIGRCASWGLRWSHPDSWIHRLRQTTAAPRIPTQILSSLHAGLAGVVLLVLSLRPSSPGALAAIGLLLYCVARFGTEHLREEARFGRWELTAGQIGSAAAFALGLTLLALLPGEPEPFWAGGTVAQAWHWVTAASATAFILTFLVYGPHWKRIGRW